MRREKAVNHPPVIVLRKLDTLLVSWLLYLDVTCRDKTKPAIKPSAFSYGNILVGNMQPCRSEESLISARDPGLD
jgi:hypothetical protein